MQCIPIQKFSYPDFLHHGGNSLPAVHSQWQKKIAESVPVAFIKALECADKGYISQAAGHFIQMAVCFQSVDEVSLTKYDEDIIKQWFVDLQRSHALLEN